MLDKAMLARLVATLTALALVVALASLPARALTPAEILDDPALEQRAREISKELRCLVCQNQSIDDSDAPLAQDLRTLVRERVVAGYSNDEVLSFVVARYGDFVLLRPPINAQTILLWTAPTLVLLAGVVGIFMTVRRRRIAPAGPTAPPLSPDEEAALRRILEGEREKG